MHQNPAPNNLDLNSTFNNSICTKERLRSAGEIFAFNILMASVFQIPLTGLSRSYGWGLVQPEWTVPHLLKKAFLNTSSDNSRIFKRRICTALPPLVVAQVLKDAGVEMAPWKSVVLPSLIESALNLILYKEPVEKFNIGNSQNHQLLKPADLLTITQEQYHKISNLPTKDSVSKFSLLESARESYYKNYFRAISTMTVRNIMMSSALFGVDEAFKEVGLDTKDPLVFCGSIPLKFVFGSLSAPLEKLAFAYSSGNRDLVNGLFNNLSFHNLFERAWARGSFVVVAGISFKLARECYELYKDAVDVEQDFSYSFREYATFGPVESQEQKEEEKERPLIRFSRWMLGDLLDKKSLQSLPTESQIPSNAPLVLFSKSVMNSLKQNSTSVLAN